MSELKRRQKISGIQEKKNRKKNRNKNVW
jgi:hypothetical protein